MAKLLGSEEAKLLVKRSDPGDQKGAIIAAIFLSAFLTILHILLQ